MVSRLRVIASWHGQPDVAAVSRASSQHVCDASTLHCSACHAHLCSSGRRFDEVPAGTATGTSQPQVVALIASPKTPSKLCSVSACPGGYVPWPASMLQISYTFMQRTGEALEPAMPALPVAILLLMALICVASQQASTQRKCTTDESKPLRSIQICQLSSVHSIPADSLVQRRRLDW